MRELIKKILNEEISLIEDRKPKGFWLDKENLRKEALKYKTRSEFQQKSQTAYSKASKMGKEFLNSITQHMTIPKSMTPYTDEELETIASKFNTKKEFNKSFPGAYQVALKRGKEFWDKITSHMEVLGSKHSRLVYAYFFPENNAVYVGLTYNIKERDFQHLKSEKHLTSVRRFMIETNEIPKLVKLTDLIDVKEAQNKENEFLEKFKKEGYTILNKVKTGGLGHGLKYKDSDLERIALLYDNIKDFYSNDLQAYKSARRRGEDFLNKITSHMKRNQESWDEKKVRDYAVTFTSKNEFQKKYPGAVTYAKKIGIWNSLFPKIQFPTNDEIIIIGSEFDTQNDFRLSHPDLFNHAKNINLLQQIPFKKTRKKSKILSDQDIINRASEYETLKDFYTNDNTAYRAAKRRGKEFFNSIEFKK